MPSYVSLIASHLDRLIAGCADRERAMWPSVLDVRAGRYPAGRHVPQRVYRLIGAPNGSTPYWDQPMILAARHLSELAGDGRYAAAADRYIDAFLARCIKPNGMFQWGNHAYFDVFDDTVVEFHKGYHELRPITPAWELFWEHDRDATATYLRAMGQRHVYNPDTGGFNRHDDGRCEHAFIEAGGILSESLAWLAGKTGDAATHQLALKVAGYSFNQRHPDTGLLPNEPDRGRWDAHVCTTEVGVWAQSLLRAADHADEAAFIDMARDATRAYLRYGFDESTGRCFGQVGVADGEHVVPEQPGYWPGAFADAWNTDQWPTHDYPMPLAEACLTLAAITGDQAFEDAAIRLANDAWQSRPSATGRWAYAESYGRCIHLFTRLGVERGETTCLERAAALADEAVAALHEHDMIQGFPGGGVYESVDGVGYLFLALIYLQTQEPLGLDGFGF